MKELKYKVGDKVLMNKDSEYWGQQLDSVFGTIVTIYTDYDYEEDFHHYVVLWNSIGKIGYKNFYREKDLLPYTDLKVNDYVVTSKGLIGKILTITPNSYELKSLDDKIFRISSHNAIKIEI